MLLPLTSVQQKGLLDFLRGQFDAPGLDYRLSPTPLPGGADNRVFRFGLSPDTFSHDLVLRLYRASLDAASRAQMESLVQNCLAAAGFPSPPVYETCLDSSILGTPFVVMKFLAGQPLLVHPQEREAARLMGTIHATLHSVEPGPVVAALKDSGLATFRLEERLVVLGGLVTGHAWLQASFDWLRQNRPKERSLSICHGDFHSLNVLVNDGQVAGVVDWSNFTIMEPAFDVVATVISIAIVGKHLGAAGTVAGLDPAQATEIYLRSYESQRSLDRSHWDYYWVLRSFLIVLFADRGIAVFRHAGMLDELARGIERITGLGIARPQL